MKHNCPQLIDRMCCGGEENNNRNLRGDLETGQSNRHFPYNDYFE